MSKRTASQEEIPASVIERRRPGDTRKCHHVNIMKKCIDCSPGRFCPCRIPSVDCELHNPNRVCRHAPEQICLACKSSVAHVTKRRRLVTETESSSEDDSPADDPFLLPPPLTPAFQATQPPPIIERAIKTQYVRAHAQVPAPALKLPPAVTPVATPVITPTVAPVAAPVITPAAAPVITPVITPVAAPVITPAVAQPVIPEVIPEVIPMTAPVVASQVAPTVMPVVASQVAPTVMPVVAPKVTPTVMPAIVRDYSVILIPTESVVVPVATFRAPQQLPNVIPARVLIAPFNSARKRSKAIARGRIVA